MAEELPAARSSAIPKATTRAWPERFAPLLLASIILVGFGIRLTGLKWGQAYSYFGQGDAVEAYQVALNYGHGEPRAQYLGQPNYNYHSKLPGPLWTILCFESCRFWGSVEGIVVTVILLNTAAIWLIYVLSKLTIGPRWGLLTALFAATLPWVVYYSNAVYNPDVMAFLAALLFLALWKTTQAERTRMIFCVPILLVSLPQFHMSGLLLIPAVILILILNPRPLNWTWLGFGFAAALAIYAPYIRGEMAHGWQNTRMMFTSQGSGRGYSFESLKAISAPLSFLVNWGPRWVRSAAEYREFGRACFGSFGVLLGVNIISMALAGLIILGAFLEIRESMTGFWREPRAVFSRSPGVSLLTILLLGPLLVATLAGQPFHTRYCVAFLPSLLPLCTLGVGRWLQQSGRLATFTKALLVLTCGANLWLMPAFYFHQGRQIEQSAVFMPSFQELEMVYQNLKASVGTNAVLVQVDDSTYLKALKPNEKQARDASLIRPYVKARELDSFHGVMPWGAEVFELRRADSSYSDSKAIAYHAHGIQLVRKAVAASSAQN